MHRFNSLTGTIILLTTLCLTGCIQINGDVYLNKDGSGTITVTELVSADGLVFLNGLTAAGQLPKIDFVDQITTINETELRNRAKQFSKGIEYVKAQAVKLPDGSIGKITTYSFDNVNNITLFKDAKTKEILADINYSDNRLTISAPITDDETKEFMAGIDSFDKIPAPLKAYFKGIKFTLLLHTSQPIIKTNSHYPLPDYSGIKLASIDLGELINTPAAITAIRDFNPADIPGFYQAIAPFNWLQIEVQDKIVIEF